MNILVNDDIRLTEIRRSDKAAYLEHLEEREISDWTLRIPYPYTEADFEAWMSVVDKSTQEQGQPVVWAIRNEHDDLLGGCGFHDFVVGQLHRAEIGYWLAKPYWGRGIMTAVVRKACDYAFAHWGLVKVVAHVFPDNLASARVLQKCGFEREGYSKRHFLKEGQYRDAVVYGLLK